MYLVGSLHFHFGLHVASVCTMHCRMNSWGLLQEFTADILIRLHLAGVLVRKRAAGILRARGGLRIAAFPHRCGLAGRVRLAGILVWKRARGVLGAGACARVAAEPVAAAGLAGGVALAGLLVGECAGRVRAAFTVGKQVVG